MLLHLSFTLLSLIFYTGLLKKKPWGPHLFVCVLPGIAVRLFVVNNERGFQDSAKEESMILEILLEKL